MNIAKKKEIPVSTKSLIFACCVFSFSLQFFLRLPSSVVLVLRVPAAVNCCWRLTNVHQHTCTHFVFCSGHHNFFLIKFHRIKHSKIFLHTYTNKVSRQRYRNWHVVDQLVPAAKVTWKVHPFLVRVRRRPTMGPHQIHLDRGIICWKWLRSCVSALSSTTHITSSSLHQSHNSAFPLLCHTPNHRQHQCFYFGFVLRFRFIFLLFVPVSLFLFSPQNMKFWIFFFFGLSLINGICFKFICSTNFITLN